VTPPKRKWTKTGLPVAKPRAVYLTADVGRLGVGLVFSPKRTTWNAVVARTGAAGFVLSVATSPNVSRLRFGELNSGGSVDFRKAPLPSSGLDVNTAGAGRAFVIDASDTKPFGVKPAPMIVIVG